MQRIAKKVSIGIAVLAVVLGLALLILNIYLQSASVQERIRSATSRVLGAPVTVKSTMYTPWGGLVLRGLSYEDVRAPGVNALEADALRMRFEILPLLQHRVQISEITLFSPVLRIRQLEDGTWLIPSPMPGETEVTTGPAPTPVPTPGPTPEVPVPSAPKGATYKIELERVRIRDGRGMVTDAKGNLLMTLNKVGIDTRVAKDNLIRGKYELESMELGRMIVPRNVHGLFSFDGKAFKLPGISGKLGGGDLSGNFVVTVGPDSQFSMNLDCRNAGLMQMALEAGIISGEGTRGVANASVMMKGDPRDTKTFTGSGKIDLLEAQMEPVGFIKQIGQVLQIDELQMLTMETAHADFTIWNERVNLENVSLKSKNLILSGEGPIRFNGRLKLDAKLQVNQVLQKRLKGVMGKNFVPSSDPEYREVAFQVTGTVANPKTDLLDKLIGVNIGGDMGGFLRNLFRTPSNKEQKP